MAEEIMDAEQFREAVIKWTQRCNEYRCGSLTAIPEFSTYELEDMEEAREAGDSPEDFARELYKKDTRTAERMLGGTIN